MKKGTSKIMRRILGLASAIVFMAVLVPASAKTVIFSEGCTDLIVGKNATVDGSTIGTYSCDGARYAGVRVVPRKHYPPRAMMKIYYRPFPMNYQEYLDYLDQEVLLGKVPQVRKTYRYVDIVVWYDDVHVGGINEYGLTTGETTIGGRWQLMNAKGWFLAYSNYAESSLMTIALQRAKTARQAIQIMGSLAEEYGYSQFGEHITVTDGEEAWAVEIFGPGPDWAPGCGKPGAVWCAQRIPDDHVGVSANRSRIGEIDLDDPDHFMASPNVKSLAFEMGWWDGTEPFVWYEAYGPNPSRYASLREWRALSLVAPSLGLPPPPEGEDRRYPFSVEPDYPVTVQDIMAIHRDALQGTDFDVTEDPAFYLPSGQKSPMACPWGPGDLHQLLGVSRERSIATSSSVFSYVSQVRAGLPNSIKGCMWFGLGPADTTIYVPIYSGVTKLPWSWGHTDLNQVNRYQTFWAFNLVHMLSYIKYQDAIEDILAVVEPAESDFFDMQLDFERKIRWMSHWRGGGLGRKLATLYTNTLMEAVADAYWDLVAYMEFKYYFRASSAAAPELPSVDLPWHW